MSNACFSERRRRLGPWLFWVVIVTCLLVREGAAHHDPSEDAVALTAKINEKGPDVELLLERAWAWRVLRKLDLAIQDLAAAAALDPESVEVKQRLAQAYYADGQLTPAFETLEAALERVQAPEVKASLLMMRASIYLVWRSHAKAADDCAAAFEAFPDHRQIEWYLRRAHAQRMADRLTACRKGLRAGFEATGSAVLYTQWVDALIDDGRFDEALKEVEKQLPGLRFAAAWKIRQARIVRGREREAEARKLLDEALEELNARIRPEAEYPDITLLADRGLAHHLLGNREAARADYERAKKAGAMGWMHWRLTKVFEASDS